MSTIKELRKGDWFTLKAIDEPKENQVWVRGKYDRTLKAFECYCFGDVNRTRYIKGNKLVYTEFTF